jgi:ketosteroid isomerase-like protein
VSDDLPALREANERFYKAVESLDIEAMDRLWLHEDWVRCVHPGWEMLSGWGAIRRSWEQIFAKTNWIRVTPTNVELAAIGDVGIVTCSENISATREGDVGLALAQATNLYKRGLDGWRLFHHHASPAPMQVTQPFTGIVQ